MTSSPLAFEVLHACLEGRSTSALQRAMDKGDLTALAVVTMCDKPSADRLSILLDRADGPVIAAELAVATVERGDESELLEVMDDAVSTRREALTPNTNQLDRLSELIAQTPNKLRAASLLAWIAIHDVGRALALGAAICEEATAGAPDALVTRALALLGSSDRPTHRSVVTDLALKCAEANEPQPVDAIIGHLDGVTDEDLDAVVGIASLYPPQGWPPPASLVSLLGGLDPQQIRTLVETVPNRIEEAWFNQHLLPHLTSKQAQAIARSLDASWWPESSIGWLIAQAPWEDHEDALWEDVLRRCKRRPDESLATTARTRISNTVIATADQVTSTTQMPRLGVHLLIGEALGGEIASHEPVLVSALNSIESAVRISEYRRSRWAQSSRAAIMGSIVSAIDVADVEPLVPDIFDLRASARDAFLASVAPHLTEVQVEAIVEAAGDDEDALRQLASSDVGATAVLSKWNGSAHLPSWRALEVSDMAQDRLAHVPSAVRDYQNHLTAPERRELLAAFGDSEERYTLLLDMVNDSSAHPPPSSATLVNVIDLLGDHLSGGADTEKAVEILRPICEQQDDMAVRQSAYSALSRATATDSLVELLGERASAETNKGRPAVGAAIQGVTAQLVAQASDPNPQAAISAVAMLERIKPEAALPDARRIATTAPRAQDRIRALRIIAEHGDRASDPDLLRRVADDHPDLTVRTEAERAIRRLEIGDLHAAHERLGEMAELDPTWWSQLDPTRLFGTWGDALREGLDRVATNEGDENWGQAIDQLGEVAKILLYRCIDLAGTTAGVSSKLISGARTNDLAFGTALEAQQLLQTWSWIHHFASLHEQRTEHLVARGSTQTLPKMELADYEHAMRLFRDGANPCCFLIAQHAP